MNSIHKHNMPNWRVDNVWAFGLSIVSTIFTVAFLYFSIVGDIKFIKQEVVYVRSDLNKLTQELENHEVSGLPFRNDLITLKAQVNMCCPKN